MKNYIYRDQHGRQPQKKRGLIRVVVGIICLIILVVLGFMAVEIVIQRQIPLVVPQVEVHLAPPPVLEIPKMELELAKKDLPELLGVRDITTDGQSVLGIIDRDGHYLYVRTTIVPALQAKARDWVQSSRAHQAALVVLDPDSSEVLALVGYQADGQKPNVALASSFPAASLFKIVTAAAAVEKGELSAKSKLAYDGGKYTLYKGNLSKAPDEGRKEVTLRESFADSINTVFGKLGAFTLGPEEMAAFANRFGFNNDISFEMPVEMSNFKVDQDDTFHLAELASGYNRSTKVSPLHGALMAAAVVAGGRIFEPNFVKEIFDRDNHIYYQASGQEEPRQIISPQTAEEMTLLMRSAVLEGTGRRTFGLMKSHPILSQLDIGGKSGSINNDQGQRVDWFVAWAKPLPGTGSKDKLALSAVVVHSGVTNTTSQKLIRDALESYYKDRLSPAKLN